MSFNVCSFYGENMINLITRMVSMKIARLYGDSVESDTFIIIKFPIELQKCRNRTAKISADITVLLFKVI